MATSNKRMSLVLLTVSVAAVAVFFGWQALNGRAQAKKTETSAVDREKPAVVVTVEQVTRRAIRRTVQVVGSLHGREEISLSPKVDGRIITIHHDVGDTVKSGELLLELDRVDFELAFAEARRGLELELARLGLSELPRKDFDVRSLPSVIRALAHEKNAAAKRDRLSRLGDSRAASVEDRDNADRDYNVATAEYSQSLLDAQTTLASARYRQATLDSALQRLKDTRLVVPGDTHSSQEYVISRRSVSEGEIVRAMPGMNSSMFDLIVDRPLKLMAAVPERHKSEIRVGQDADLRVETFPKEVFIGKVVRVSPSIERASRTFSVEIHIPNEDRRLSPGSFAKISILTRVDSHARTVPEEAIVSFAGVNKLFVVNQDRAREIPVQLGATLDSGERAYVEILTELPEYSHVATSGQTQLADNVRVQIRDDHKNLGTKTP